MQRIKSTKKVSELEGIASNPEVLTSSLTEVMDRFNISKHFSLFDFLKSKGLAVSSLLGILVILPFYGVANIYSLYKCGINSLEFDGKKDVYYDIKNNENIRWRELFRHRYKTIPLIG